MANVIDFSQLRQDPAPLSSIVDPIAAAIQHQADLEWKAKEADKQREAQYTVPNRRLWESLNETERRNRATEDAKQRQLVGQETASNRKARESTNELVRGDIANSDYGRAQQRAGAYQEVDPETGKVQSGLPGFKMITPQAPAFPRRAAGSIEGPMATPEILDDAAVERAGQNAQAGLGGDGGNVLQERQKLQQSEDAFAKGNTPSDPLALAAYQGERERFTPEDNPTAAEPYKGAQVTIGGAPADPDQLRHAASRAQAEDFKKLGDTLMSNHTAAMQTRDPQAVAQTERQLRTYNELLAGVESGQIPGTKAAEAVISGQGAEDKRGAATEMQGQKDAASLERTNVIAAAHAAEEVKKREAKNPGGVDPKIYARVQQDYAAFDKNHTVSTDRAEEYRLKSLVANADQPVVQRSIASVLARGLAGEKGALSNQDINRLQGDLGGAWADVENWLSKKGSGALDPAILNRLVAGINVVLGEKDQKRQGAEAAYAAKFMRPGYIGQSGGLADDINNTFEERFGHPYQPPGAAGAPRRDTSNPDDPNAHDAERPLDGEADEPPRLSRDAALKEAKRRGLLP